MASTFGEKTPGLLQRLGFAYIVCTLNGMLRICLLPLDSSLGPVIPNQNGGVTNVFCRFL